MSIYNISQTGPILGSQALVPGIFLPENPLAIQPAIRPIPNHSVPAYAYEARYANNAIKSMETALKNRKPMKKFGIMGDYDADMEHVASRGPSVRGVRGWAVAAAVAALTMAGVDVVWLGFVAKGLFQKEIGHLLAKDVNFLAAGLFYVFYVTTILVCVHLCCLQARL